ncbi:unnamed protein product [Linum tenue]|uniref:ATP-dependent DNA helicase n=1 Tax=Linum tenue TaxID=586396 RepID=A0AAV0HEZ5_9ROSI|nr:unnamed protein product [Linum tenue]
MDELIRKVLIFASSGIAATLLPNAVTAHSRFKIPLEVDQNSTCSVHKGTQLAHSLAEADLIIWDEAPMIHRLAFEAVDRTLCDIMNVPFTGKGYKPFGGKTVLLGGDFRQTLHVVPNAGREESVDSSLTRSYLWKYCAVLHLSRNMRITSSPINQQPTFACMTFADWTLSVGNGQIPATSFSVNQPADWISIPSCFLLDPSSQPTATICDEIYSDFSANYHHAAYLIDKAIVTPTNKNVTKINKHMMNRVRGRVHSYFSAEKIHSDSKDSARLEVEYPTEFLNTLAFSGFPDHEIELKVFSPVMLLRNLNPEIGLGNGTRIMVTYLITYVIKGLIMGGAYAGKVVAIPRIVVNIDNQKWPFMLKRRQFPVRLCYAMTINKSQGQTLTRVGVFLPKPVFSHGQLYVAISRVRSAEGLKFLIQNEDHIPLGYTRNIVYSETFDSLGGASLCIPPTAIRFASGNDLSTFSV